MNYIVVDMVNVIWVCQEITSTIVRERGIVNNANSNMTAITDGVKVKSIKWSIINGAPYVSIVK